MKVALQYLNDVNGNIQAVQLPVSDWKKVLAKLKKYEEALKLKSDLKEAYEQVTSLKQTKGKKETLNDFLNGL
jgi:predicted transglutaminase-like protease